MLRFVDSCSHYSSDYVIRKYKAGAYVSVHPTEGRFGGGCLGSLTSMGGEYVTILLDNQANWIVGFAYKVLSLTNTPIVTFLDGANHQCDLYLNQDGTISIRQNGTVLGTTTVTPALDTYYYYELKLNISNSANVELRRESQTIMSLSGVNSQTTLNSWANRIQLHPGANNRYCDIVVCDTQGTRNNNFLGPIRVLAVLPNADGSYTDLTPSTGMTRYSMVDEQVMNGDTDFISGKTAGNKASFLFPSLPVVPGSIAGVQTVIAARKDSTDNKSIQTLLRRSGTDTLLQQNDLTTSFDFYMDIVEVDPNTGAPFTVANLQNTELGLNIIG